MSIEDLFHSSDDVHEQVNKSWKWVKGFIPVPKFTITCPECSHDKIQLSNISYSKRGDSKHPYRAEPSFKCTKCSFFWTHGIVCSEDVFRKGTGDKKRLTWRWREVREVAN